MMYAILSEEPGCADTYGIIVYDDTSGDAVWVGRAPTSFELIHKVDKLFRGIEILISDTGERLLTLP